MNPSAAPTGSAAEGLAVADALSARPAGRVLLRRAGRSQPARARAGLNGTRPRARSTPCTEPSAPTTIGEALDVPLKRSVYQRSALARPEGRRSRLVTSRPQPCASSRAP